jgi:hypothetical protein
LRRISHNGQVAGFAANFIRFPDEEVVFIVFMNRYRIGGGRSDAIIETFMPGLSSDP